MSRIGRAIRGAALGISFVLVLELCARCDDLLTWHAPWWGDYSEEGLTVVDALGPRCRPNGQFEKWQLDSHGFRGPEVPLEKAPGVTRVLVVGASETFGLYESPGREYPAELARQLATVPGRRFEVINAACAGMSPPRIVQLLGSYLGRFHPDVVLFYPSPHFYLGGEPPRPWNGHPQAASEPLLTLRLARRVKTGLKAVLPEALQTWLREQDIQRRVRRHGPGWVWLRPPEDRVELFRADLRDLVATTQRLGAKPILLTHANRFSAVLSEKDHQQLVALRKFYPRASVGVFVPFEAAMNQAILDEARDLGVPAIDVERRLGKDPACFADFSHFTDRGAQAMALILRDGLLRLAPGSQTRSR